MVHIHAEGPAFFCWIPKLFGKRVIVTIHGDYGYFGKGDTGYAQYMTAFNRNFGGSSGGGGGGDGSGCGCLIAIAVVVVLILIVLGG